MPFHKKEVSTGSARPSGLQNVLNLAKGLVNGVLLTWTACTAQRINRCFFARCQEVAKIGTSLRWKGAS